MPPISDDDADRITGGGDIHAMLWASQEVIHATQSLRRLTSTRQPRLTPPRASKEVQSQLSRTRIGEVQARARAVELGLRLERSHEARRL